MKKFFRSGNDAAISDFLNQQNISDVAELIEENEEREMGIFQHLSMHRAVSLFKILEHSIQKRIIKNLPPAKSAELLNICRLMTVPIFWKISRMKL